MEATRGCLELEAICKMTIAFHRKKNWVEKSKTQKSLGVLRNIISKKLRTNEKTILRMDEFENPKSRSGIY